MTASLSPQFFPVFRDRARGRSGAALLQLELLNGLHVEIVIVGEAIG